MEGPRKKTEKKTEMETEKKTEKKTEKEKQTTRTNNRGLRASRSLERVYSDTLAELIAAKLPMTTAELEARSWWPFVEWMATHHTGSVNAQVEAADIMTKGFLLKDDTQLAFFNQLLKSLCFATGPVYKGAIDILSEVDTMTNYVDPEPPLTVLLGAFIAAQKVVGSASINHIAISIASYLGDVNDNLRLLYSSNGFIYDKTITEVLSELNLPLDFEGSLWNAVFESVIGLRVCFLDGCGYGVNLLTFHPGDSFIPLTDAGAAALVADIFEEYRGIRPHRAYPEFSGAVHVGDGKAYGLFAVNMLQCASAATESSSAWADLAQSSQTWGDSNGDVGGAAPQTLFK